MKSRVDIPRLCMATWRSRQRLEPFRQFRLEAIKQYIGHRWNDNAAEKRRPINLVALYLKLMLRNLVAHEPRWLLSTFDTPNQPIIAALQASMNRATDKMGLAKTLQRVMLDALISIGICKVGLATAGDSSRFAYEQPAGKVYAEPIDLDDFVYDIHARDFGQIGFMGHRFRVLRDVAQKVYGRKDLPTSREQPFNREGDERVTALGRGSMSDLQEWADYTDLWEFYLPHTNTILTLTDEEGLPNGDVDPLDERDWIGPPEGPYHTIGFDLVPGNAMPAAPVRNLIDLDEALNKAARKLHDEAENLKQVTVIRTGQDRLAKAMKDANDGDIIFTDDPRDVNQVITGGPNQTLMAFFETFRNVFSWLAGNLDMIGGLSPQAKTLGQDKLLAESASATVSDMQIEATRFTSGIGRAIGWYLFHDPFTVHKSLYHVEGMPNLKVQRRLTPQQRRQTNWDDLDVMVDPYSMQHSTPQQKLQFLDNIVQQVAPMMPILQQQGIVLDANFWLKKKAEYGNSPDLSNLFTIQEPPQEGANTGQGEQPGMPTQTNRTYTRENRSEVTGPGQAKSTIQALLGQNPGGAQRNGQSAMNGAPR